MLKMCSCWLLIGIVKTNVLSKHSFASPPFVAVCLQSPQWALHCRLYLSLACAAGRALTNLEHRIYTQTIINSPAKPDNGMHSPFFLLQPSKSQILPPFTVQKIPSTQGRCAAFTLMQLKANFGPKLFVYSNINLMWDIFWARFLSAACINLLKVRPSFLASSMAGRCSGHGQAVFILPIMAVVTVG